MKHPPQKDTKPHLFIYLSTKETLFPVKSSSWTAICLCICILLLFASPLCIYILLLLALRSKYVARFGVGIYSCYSRRFYIYVFMTLCSCLRKKWPQIKLLLRNKWIPVVRAGSSGYYTEKE